MVASQLKIALSNSRMRDSVRVHTNSGRRLASERRPMSPSSRSHVVTGFVRPFLPAAQYVIPFGPDTVQIGNSRATQFLKSETISSSALVNRGDLLVRPPSAMKYPSNLILSG